MLCVTGRISRCDSIDKLKAKLPSVEMDLRDPAKFKDFYQFTFMFARTPGQKGLGEIKLFKMYSSPGSQLEKLYSKYDLELLCLA